MFGYDPIETGLLIVLITMFLFGLSGYIKKGIKIAKHKIQGDEPLRREIEQALKNTDDLVIANARLNAHLVGALAALQSDYKRAKSRNELNNILARINKIKPLVKHERPIPDDQD
ncbi:hypothetical protein A2382_01780 [Candidatus Woesebacteria bacterium RIFOXYB1_FULL_38_16]|uniref:Uncharacterized protein n=1 Tax=Candidatus Woesebacteria bacterium RIFOXYB1_FULL_38_16 TaxID=1802538 RepID=A0A1F8CTM6_9BACT|nr:MAG: hypothetical protein A2191_02745 [Candidatus Woesebacteria bacterium RIFOXYA1_FULL_38_9]OGM79631.1 MAG: hypothetical protein A2382_01780 [Candidatus Woesebacteria bacterium RIFOXYB1_FULL_38_16]